MVNNLYWGSIDTLMLLIIIAVNVIIYFKSRTKKLGCLVVLMIALLYVIVLPLTSQIVEIRRVVAVNGVDDSFTLLYTYSRFPIYWSLGFIQLIILVMFYKYKGR